MYMKIENVPVEFCENFCSAWNKKKRCCNRWSNPYANQVCLWTKEEMENEIARAKYDDDNRFRGQRKTKKTRKQKKRKEVKNNGNNKNKKKKIKKNKLQF